MVRKQVYMERRQDRELKRLAKETGKTEAEILRDAFDRYAAETASEKERLRAWEEQKAFISDWIAQGPVPATGRKWSREDAHERPRTGRH